LLESLLEAGYGFFRFEEYCRGEASGKYVLLRHDIDRNPQRALQIAEIDAEYGIRSTFYFRAQKSVFKQDVIRAISELNHEIGYHYLDLSAHKGDVQLAVQDFEKHLNMFREIVPVTTISMDGSPMSRYDNRHLWRTYDYHDFGIIGEPYFDVDFSEVLYLTDTGRCWDGDRFSVRDKVKSGFDVSFHSSEDLMRGVSTGALSDQMMLTTHPQRWTDQWPEWLWELLAQNLKNQLKRILVKREG